MILNSSSSITQGVEGRGDVRRDPFRVGKRHEGRDSRWQAENAHRDEILGLDGAVSATSFLTLPNFVQATIPHLESLIADCKTAGKI